MGRFAKDKEMLLTLLAAGLDPMAGISMYQDALTAKRERADDREYMEQRLMEQSLPTLQSGADWGQTRATLNSLGDAYDVGPNVLKETKQNVLEDFYGGDREGENVFVGEEGDLGWDESDEQIVKTMTEQGAQLGYGRAEIRERLTNKLRDQYGEEAYKKYAPRIHQAIDMYWPGYGDNVPGGAVPENDDWLRNFDAGAAPSGSKGLKGLSEREKLAEVTMGSQVPTTRASLDLNPRQYQGVSNQDQATAAAVMTAPDSGFGSLIPDALQQAIGGVPVIGQGLRALSSIWGF